MMNCRGDMLFIQCMFCDHETKMAVEHDVVPAPSKVVRMYQRAADHVQREHVRKRA